MTPKQQLFVKEYLVDLNATRAYIAAGYSENGAEVSASKLLRNAKVKAEIAKATLRIAKKLDITAEKVLGELAKMGFSNMLDYIKVQEGEAVVDLSAMTREQAAAIQEITSEVYVDGYVGTGEDRQPIKVKRTKFKLAEKRGSLELLGRYLKLFAEKDPAPTNIPIQFVTNLVLQTDGQR